MTPQPKLGAAVALEAEVIEIVAMAQALTKQAHVFQLRAAQLQEAFYEAHPDGAQGPVTARTAFGPMTQLAAIIWQRVRGCLMRANAACSG